MSMPERDADAPGETTIRLAPAPAQAETDLSVYDRTLGKFLFLISKGTGFSADPEDIAHQRRRAALVRTVMAGGIIALSATFPAFYETLPVVFAYLLVSAAGLVYSLVRRPALWVMAISGAGDVAIVTYAVHLTGSLTTVVVFLYPMLSMLGTLFAGIPVGLFYAVAGSLAYSILVLAEGLGWVSYSPLMGHAYPYFTAGGIPTYPLLVLVLAHLANYGSVGMGGLVTYALEKRRREAQRAFEARTELAAICSHDLKNLLASVLGHAELAEMRLDAGDPEKARDNLRQIRRSGDRMMELIRDLLDLSRLEAGKIALSRSRFDLVRTVQGTVHSLEPAAQRKEIAIETELPEGPVQFHGDQSKIIQVMTNLLHNAVQYTPEKGRVRVRIVQGSGTVSVTVADTGPGLPPEEAELIFDPAALTKKRGSRFSLSTGLGLNIVRRLTELHGGRVWAESSPQGTVFGVEIPLHE